MRVTLDKLPIGTGSLLFHITTYDRLDSGLPGTMRMVAADNMAQALYLAWVEHFDDTEPLDLERCDGYLIGHIERSL
jgi:hypothetical protein